MAKTLVGGDAFAVDAGMIKANVNRQRGLPDPKGPALNATGYTLREYPVMFDDAAFGGAALLSPKFAWLTDSVPGRTRANGGVD